MDGLLWTNGWTFTACKLICSFVLDEDSTDALCRWEANESMMNVSCDALGYYGVPNPSREELDGILEAISAESKDSGLDERFLLAIMVSLASVFVSIRVVLTIVLQMQESKGCVRAKSTSSPGDLIRNPGLMQVSTRHQSSWVLLEVLTKTCNRRTMASAAATKTGPWRILAQTLRSNK
jgi:hypothetical protein